MTFLTRHVWGDIPGGGCDGMSTLQNGTAAYSVSQSHVFARVVSRYLPVVFVFLSVLLW